ncbi:MAG: hypothetical protein ACYTHK_07090 [Planctomycetota bacterium]
MWDFYVLLLAISVAFGFIGQVGGASWRARFGRRRLAALIKLAGGIAAALAASR